MKEYEEEISKSDDNNIPELKTEVFYWRNFIRVLKTEMSKKIFNIRHCPPGDILAIVRKLVSLQYYTVSATEYRVNNSVSVMQC